MPQSTPGNVLTVQPDGFSVAAEPPAGGSASSIGQYSASAGTNSFDTTAGANFVAASGTFFIETSAGDFLALTEEGCVVTYNGADAQRFSVRLFASVTQTTPVAAAFAFLGVDHSGDLLGQPGATTFQGIQETQLGSAGEIVGFGTERVVSLAPGETVQPVLALDPITPGTAVSIFRLTMVVEPVR